MDPVIYETFIKVIGSLVINFTFAVICLSLGIFTLKTTYPKVVKMIRSLATDDDSILNSVNNGSVFIGLCILITVIIASTCA